MAGLPGVDSLASYGGEKANYEPVEDPTTDLDADHWSLVASNVAGMSQTIDRAWCAFVGHATTPTDPVSNVHGAVWGNTPGVKPVVTKGGTGIYLVTWPTSITDELGVSQTLNLRRAQANFEGATPYFVGATVTAVNVVTVRVFNAAGAANDAAGVTFSVFVT